jgi:hypothetical protein
MIDTSKFPGREMSSLLINAPSPTPNDDPFAEGFGGEPGTNGGEDMEMDEEVYIIPIA